MTTVKKRKRSMMSEEYYSKSDSEGSEMSDDSSAHFKNCSSAGLRKTINKQINKIFRERGVRFE